MKIIGYVTFLNHTHKLVQANIPVTKRALDRLKEREATNEIFIQDFKEVINDDGNND